MNLLAILLAATMPLRNPFWPVTYDGTREVISDEVRVKPVAETTAREDDTTTGAKAAKIAAAATIVEDDSVKIDRLWIKARKALKIGSTLKLGGEKGRQAVTINGNIYADGDLVSFNCDGYRFTWRVKQLTENNTLKLVRLRARELDDDLKGNDK